MRDVYIQSGSVTLRHLGAIASHIQHMAPIPLARFRGRSHFVPERSRGCQECPHRDWNTFLEMFVVVLSAILCFNP